MNSSDKSGASALLLVPGLMCDHAVWNPVLSALAQVRHCTVVDHGAADSLPLMAQQILQSAPPRFALAGHSMGARVVLEVLRLAPQRVDGVALLSSGYAQRPEGEPGEEEARKRYALLDIARAQGVRAMATAWVAGMVHPDRLNDQVLMDSVVQMFERKSADIFARQIQALLNRPPAQDVLQQTLVPTLVLCGRQDAWATVAQHQAMHGMVRSAELAVIDHAGHMVTMERPAEVASAMLQWLRRVPVQ
jgi:pimeloyl-ACP methyl ester carboxylesterase